MQTQRQTMEEKHTGWWWGLPIPIQVQWVSPNCYVCRWQHSKHMSKEHNRSRRTYRECPRETEIILWCQQIKNEQKKMKIMACFSSQKRQVKTYEKIKTEH